MNNHIRIVALAQLRAKGMSYIDLARMTGSTTEAIARAFGETSNRGGISQLWSDILNALDLELTAQPRLAGSSKPGEGEA